MMPILYRADETEFDTYGIGMLSDCTFCEVIFHRFLENSLKKSMLKLRKNSFLSLGILCITIIESLGTICYHKEKWYFII